MSRKDKDWDDPWPNHGPERTYRWAMKRLPKDPEVRAAFERAWKATNCGDSIYNGELASYMIIIAQTLETQNAQLAAFKRIIHDLENYLSKMKDDIKRDVTFE